jgi:hypothetical protein
MSAGQAARGGLRSRRLRIALGATAAAAALAIGGTFTAHADSSGPAPERSGKHLSVTDPCWESEPAKDVVDAVPGGNEELPKPDSYKDVYFDDTCAEPEPAEDPVDAVPGENEKLPKPDFTKDALVADKLALAKR